MIPEDTVEIHVPPVRNRWNYKTHDLDRTVDRILREDKEDGDIVYLAQYEDGRKEKVRSVKMPPRARRFLFPILCTSDHSSIISRLTKPPHAPKSQQSLNSCRLNDTLLDPCFQAHTTSITNESSYLSRISSAFRVALKRSTNLRPA